VAHGRALHSASVSTSNVAAFEATSSLAAIVDKSVNFLTIVSITVLGFSLFPTTIVVQVVQSARCVCVCLY